jgi:hypothetical protein
VTARGASGALRPPAQRSAPGQPGDQATDEPSEEPIVDNVNTGNGLGAGAIVGMLFVHFLFLVCLFSVYVFGFLRLCLIFLLSHSQASQSPVSSVLLHCLAPLPLLSISSSAPQIQR